MYHCFEELDDAVVILDRDNNVARLNGSFQETFGIGDDAAQGMEIGNLIALHLAPLFEEGLCRSDNRNAPVPAGGIACHLPDAALAWWDALVLVLVPGDDR